MQQNGALAYQQVAKQTLSPRELEANLLSRSAGKLQRIRESWDLGFADLNEALLFNRKLWTIFLTTVTREENPLPQAIRQNIANLGLFVMNQTVEIQNTAAPKPDQLDILITINRELASGLRAAGANAAR